ADAEIFPRGVHLFDERRGRAHGLLPARTLSLRAVRWKTKLMSSPSFSRIVLLGHTGYIGSRLAAAFEAAAPDVPLVGRSAPTLDLTRQDSSAALEQLLDRDCVLVVCAAIKKQLGDSPEIFAQNLA